MADMVQPMLERMIPALEELQEAQIFSAVGDPMRKMSSLAPKWSRTQY